MPRNGAVHKSFAESEKRSVQSLAAHQRRIELRSAANRNPERTFRRLARACHRQLRRNGRRYRKRARSGAGGDNARKRFAAVLRRIGIVEYARAPEDVYVRLSRCPVASPCQCYAIRGYWIVQAAQLGPNEILRELSSSAERRNVRTTRAGQRIGTLSQHRRSNADPQISGARTAAASSRDVLCDAIRSRQ